MRRTIVNIEKAIGTPAILEQTAEECVELADAVTALLKLAHACQKEARRLRGENPTPATEEECRAAIREEMADVSVCLGQMNAAGYPIDLKAVCSKIERWKSRIDENVLSKAGKTASKGPVNAPERKHPARIKIYAEDDLIPRAEAMNAIRRACISAHVPWKSSSPQGQTALEALSAVNSVPPISWDADKIGLVIHSCIKKKQTNTALPFDCVCEDFYMDLNEAFWRLSGGINIDGTR